MPAKGQSRLTVTQKCDVLTRHQRGESTVAIGKQYCMSPSSIALILQGQGAVTSWAWQPTPQVLRSLVDRFQAGEDRTTLAAEVGIHPGTLTRHFRKAGVCPLSRSQVVVRTHTITIPNLPEIAKRHADGEFLGTLADELGILYNTLSMKLKAAGYAVRSRHNEKKDILDDELVRKYHGGASVCGLGEVYGISTNAVRNRLLRNSVKLRHESETRENLLTFATPIEADLVAEIRTLGICCTPQKAELGRNIDIALDDLPIAIEIENGSAMSGRSRSRFLRRTTTILDRGWCLFFVVTHGKYIYEWDGVLDALIPLIDRANNGEIIAGSYGVVNARGQVLRHSRYNFEGLPRLHEL